MSTLSSGDANFEFFREFWSFKLFWRSFVKINFRKKDFEKNLLNFKKVFVEDFLTC